MKFISITILTVATLLNCSCRETTNSISDMQKVSDKESLQKEEQGDNSVPAIMVIDFKIKATGEDLKDFKDGFVPWISIDNPEAR